MGRTDSCQFFQALFQLLKLGLLIFQLLFILFFHFRQLLLVVSACLLSQSLAGLAHRTTLLDLFFEFNNSVAHLLVVEVRLLSHLLELLLHLLKLGGEEVLLASLLLLEGGDLRRFIAGLLH